MTSTIQDVMTTDLVTCPTTATLADAARLMRERDVGDVLVTRGDRLAGIVTDRDLVVRCLAEGAGADASLEMACTSDLTTLPPDASIDAAAATMRDQAKRRIPVVQDGRAVGIVTLGDLAIAREPDSALGGISAAAPDS